jgi:cytidylate kinase
VCIKDAKGKENIAKAELEARANPSERAKRKVEEAKAEAKYEVAKERCDDMKGKDIKDACQKEAKAEHERAKAAMAKRTASTGTSR